MWQRIIFSLFCISILNSCGVNDIPSQKTKLKNDTLLKVDECVKRLIEVKRLDNILLKATILNKEVAENAINVFYNFAINCKQDTLAPVFLLKSGQVAQSIKKYTQAQSCFKTCIDEFPKFKGRGAAMFLLAQLYDDSSMLNNESEARTIYHQIIREYPSTSFASDARACLQNIGKSDEELVKEFLKKNN